jgi:hypothetical protein
MERIAMVYIGFRMRAQESEGRAFINGPPIERQSPDQFPISRGSITIS